MRSAVLMPFPCLQMMCIRDRTGSVPDSAGVPAGYAAATLLAEYNDIESVRRLLEENEGQVACIVVEPVAANMGVVPPEEGFLAALREAADAYGALLIFDEVITGFRLGLGGAQGYYGVMPDLSTFGKICLLYTSYLAELLEASAPAKGGKG